MSLIKVIREKCLECCCQSPSEVRLCNIEECPLHPYRMGKDPFRKKKTLSEEHKEKLRLAREARMKKGE